MSQHPTIQAVARRVDGLIRDARSRRIIVSLAVRGLRDERRLDRERGAELFPAHLLTPERAALRLLILRDACCADSDRPPVVKVSSDAAYAIDEARGSYRRAIRDLPIVALMKLAEPFGRGEFRDKPESSGTEAEREAAAAMLAMVEEALRPVAVATAPTAPAPKPRTKRAVAEPLIRDHLLRRPHDSAQDVASAVGCSVGLVGKSGAWRLNQVRLANAKKLGVDPTVISLDENWINSAGESAGRQLRDHREHVAETDEKIDSENRELWKRIDQFRAKHPDATPVEAAKAIGCMAGDVERRDAILAELVADQSADDRGEK